MEFKLHSKYKPTGDQPQAIEQLLASLMGTVDTMMVSNVGSAAISAVSLVDSINIISTQMIITGCGKHLYQIVPYFDNRHIEGSSSEVVDKNFRR